MERDLQDDRGDLDAWVRRHQARAWRFVRLRGCPADLADDLVQEALMAAVQKGIPTQPDGCAAGWLRGALENLWLMHLRTDGRRNRHVDAAVAARALQQCAAHDDGTAWIQALRRCLESLDGRARQLLDLHYDSGASRNAIASEFGMQANGVKAFLRRVRDSLRDCVLRRLRSEGSDVDDRA